MKSIWIILFHNPHTSAWFPMTEQDQFTCAVFNSKESAIIAAKSHPVGKAYGYTVIDPSEYHIDR